MTKHPPVMRTETVAAVRERQACWVGWMQDATAGLDDDDLIVTHTAVYPFGSYLLAIERLDQPTPDVVR